MGCSRNTLYMGMWLGGWYLCSHSRSKEKCQGCQCSEKGHTAFRCIWLAKIFQTISKQALWQRIAKFIGNGGRNSLRRRQCCCYTSPASIFFWCGSYFNKPKRELCRSPRFSWRQRRLENSPYQSTKIDFRELSRSWNRHSSTEAKPSIRNRDYRYRR